jgi:hypothetical protein
MEDVYFMDTWSTLRPFVILYGHLVQFVVIWYNFFPSWYFVQRKIWQPWRGIVGKGQKLIPPKLFMTEHPFGEPWELV